MSPRVSHPEPHRANRIRLLQRHPEIRDLYGRDRGTAAWIAVLVVFQWTLAVALAEAPWPLIIVAAYLVGSFTGHGLFVLIHETAHRLVFDSTRANTALAIGANLGHGFPGAVAFSAFHLAHHGHQGSYARDADIPMDWEARVFRGPVGKLLWLVAYPALMVVRAERVKRLGGVRPPPLAVAINVVVVAAADVGLVLLAGPGALVFLLASFYFGIGPHPLGARWIQEHFVLEGSQETNSYYGPFNRLAFNVGLHNEHNDFPSVSWRKLPAVTALASEHYRSLIVVPSYLGLLRKFLCHSRLSLRSRIVR